MKKKKKKAVSIRSKMLAFPDVLYLTIGLVVERTTNPRNKSIICVSKTRFQEQGWINWNSNLLVISMKVYLTNGNGP